MNSLRGSQIRHLHYHLDSSNVFMDQSVVRGSLNKFADFFRMGSFIDSTHMKL